MSSVAAIERSAAESPSATPSASSSALMCCSIMRYGTRAFSDAATTLPQHGQRKKSFGSEPAYASTGFAARGDSGRFSGWITCPVEEWHRRTDGIQRK